MSAASCGCSPSCRWTRSTGSARWRVRSSTRPRRSWRFEATRLCHGVEAAEQAATAARAVFEGGGDGIEGLPVVSCDAARLRAGVPVIELLFVAGLAASNGEARRLVRGGGARLNDERIDDETATVDLGARA